MSPFGRAYCLRVVGHSGPHRDRTHEWDGFSEKSALMGMPNDGFLRRRARLVLREETER